MPRCYKVSHAISANKAGPAGQVTLDVCFFFRPHSRTLPLELIGCIDWTNGLLGLVGWTDRQEWFGRLSY